MFDSSVLVINRLSFPEVLSNLKWLPPLPAAYVRFLKESVLFSYVLQDLQAIHSITTDLSINVGGRKSMLDSSASVTCLAFHNFQDVLSSM